MRILTSGRDGKIKLIDINYKTDEKTISIEEIETKSINCISSIELIHITDNYEIIICGFYGGNLILYNLSKNMLIHQMNIKGINRPLDILFDDKYSI